MKNAIVPGAIIPTSMDDLGRLCSSLAKAKGFIPAGYVGQPAAIGAAIMTGLELGLAPMQALREVYVVDGKPTLSASLMLALAIRAGVRHQWIESTSTTARLRLTRSGFEPHESEFTIQDAKRAGLDRRQNWQRHPAAMLRARCVSAALRAFCPDVLGGSVYVHGELDSDEPAPVSVEVVETPTAVDVEAVEAEILELPSAPKHLSDCQSSSDVERWTRANRVAIVNRDASYRVVEALRRMGEEEAIPEVEGWLAAE